jgi:hypothetical protein
MFVSLTDDFKLILSELRRTVPVFEPYTCTICSSRQHKDGKCLYDVLHEITPFPTVIIDMICDIKKESDDNDVLIQRQRNLMSRCLKYLPIVHVEREINSDIDNILSGNITEDFLMDMFQIVKDCDCCPRHQIRRPVDITDDTHTNYVSNMKSERVHKCNCSCRHTARLLNVLFTELT